MDHSENDRSEEFAEADRIRNTGQSVNDQATNELEQPTADRRSWIEVLVDPKTLQGLMSCGAGLLVLGLVIWLWSIGIFANKLVVASCLGIGNFALLAVGVTGARYSQYQTAGKAITMLACLVMPLNLWFYDSQGLITLDQGGRLWVPALICCALYVGVARVLADPRFVYAIVGGVTMTGLLFLADNQVGRFWEIMSPSTFLVALGMICIHVERAFAPDKGPFSRANFGRTFFHAGHVVMGLGLTVLLVGRVAGRFYETLFADLGWFAMPEVATQANLKLLAILLALGAAYSYVYSQFVVQAKGRYLASSLLTLGWAAIILLDLLQIPFTMQLVMLMTSVAALLASLATGSTQSVEQSAGYGRGMNRLIEPLSQISSRFAVGLNITTIGLGLMLYCRARINVLHAWVPYDFDWLFVIAAIIGGTSCWLATRNASHSLRSASASWSQQTGIVLGWLAVDATMACLGFRFGVVTLAVEMLVPITLAIFSLRATLPSTRLQFALAAEIVAALVLAVSVGSTLGLVEIAGHGLPHLWPTIFFAEAAVAFGLASRASSRLTPALLAAVSICATTWQLFLLLGVTHNVFLLAITFFGIVCLTASSLSRPVDGAATQFSIVSQWTGRICISYGSIAVLFIALARLLAGEATGALLGMLIVQTVAATLAGVVAKQPAWRRHFWVLATAQLLPIVLVVNSLTALSFFQRGELMLTAAGLVVLALGYWGWYREAGRREDVVSFNLAIGSFFSAAPLTLGMLVQRFDDRLAEWGWVLIHEAGVLGIGLLLLGAGVLCRIRWSTIVGGATLTVYVFSLIGLVRLPEQLQTTAIYMMVGGGLFFCTAVLLSIYRDRLLAIPKRVQEGEGVFRVLKWR